MPLQEQLEPAAGLITSTRAAHFTDHPCIRRSPRALPRRLDCAQASSMDKERPMTDQLARLLDRAALQDLMARYARAVDRRDWKTVRATFHPDAHDDHGDYKGNVDGFIAWVTDRHANIQQSMHFLGNCLIEFVGPDVALVETYFVARQTLGANAAAARTMISGANAGSGPSQMEAWGRYIDIAERRQGEWRTARRIVCLEVVESKPAPNVPIKPEWAQQKRDPSDPINDMRERAVALARKAK